MKRKTYLRPKNTFKRIEDDKFELYKKTCNRIMNLCALAVLNDKFDFSNEDMQTFQDTFEDLVWSVFHGIDDLDKIEKALIEECGIEFSEGRK